MKSQKKRPSMKKAGRAKPQKVSPEKDSSEDLLKSSEEAWPMGKNLKKVSIADLRETYPLLFDKRLKSERRFESITRKQWKEYLDDLKCAVCGEPGGNCKCTAADIHSEGEA